MEPNFFIIGAAKAATTSLSSLLEAHPQAGIARGKEPHFFSYDHVYARGWEAYLALFDHCVGRSAIGDASTSYSRIRYHPSAPDRIRGHIPAAKIIYMVRNPLERMESAYIEHLCTPCGQVFASINDAVRQQPMIVDSSRYWEVFDAYRQRFTEQQLMVVWFEEYIANMTVVFQEVCRFLQIDDTTAPDLVSQRINSRDNARARLRALGRGDVQIDAAWDAKTRHWALDQIRNDNRRFLTHFGRGPSHWGDSV
jgi:hypothetical protein